MAELPQAALDALVAGWGRDLVPIAGARLLAPQSPAAALAAWAATAETARPLVVRAQFGDRSVGALLPRLQHPFDAGGVLLAEGVDRIDPEVARVVRRLGRALGHAGALRAVGGVLPAGGAWTWVGEPALWLQRHGTTRWTAGDRAHVAHPGDLVHLPGAACGTSSGEAVGVAVGFVPVDFAELLERLVWRELAAEPAWREIPPMPTPLPPRSAEAVRARIDELAALLCAWHERPTELLRALAAERWTDANEPGEPGDVAPDVVVLRNEPGAVTVIAAQQEIEVDGDAAAVLRAALAGGSAPDAVPGVAPDRVRAVVAALRAAGVFAGQSST